MTSIGKQDNQGSPRDTLISIQDAAATAKTTVLALLEEASKGHLELLVEHRAGRQLVLRPAKRGVGKELLGRPNPFRAPDYLALGVDICRSLTVKPSTYFAEAGYGYRHDPGRINEFLRLGAPDADSHSATMPVEVEGLDDDKPLGSRWRSWALWADEKVEAVPLRRDDILLRLMELYRWMGIDPSTAPDPFFYLGKASESQPDANENDDFKSDQLLRMCEAALKLWGRDGVLPDDPSTHPSNEEVVRWLRATRSFEKTPAENAAALIKPSWGNKAGRRQK